MTFSSQHQHQTPNHTQDQTFPFAEPTHLPVGRQGMMVDPLA